MPHKMKKLFALIALSLIAAGSTLFGQEIALTSFQMQPGSNFQIGTTSLAVSPIGLNVRDQSANLLNSIPLLSAPASVGANTQITDTIYAITPPDSSNSVTVEILYQADPSQPITSAEILNAVQDTLTQNSWFGAQAQVKIASTSEILPAGTQFWVCSSAGYVTFADNGAISLALAPPTSGQAQTNVAVQITAPATASP
jgi:hypothetical protein